MLSRMADGTTRKSSAGVEPTDEVSDDVTAGLPGRDRGWLVVYSYDYREVALTGYGFLDNRTVRAVVGDQEYLFVIDERGRPIRRRP
jgi:hypothetical protein